MSLPDLCKLRLIRMYGSTHSVLRLLSHNSVPFLFSLVLAVCYQNPAIEILRSAPSMGRNEEFALLASEDPSNRSEYTSGLMFLGYFYLAFFFVWTGVVLMFKCMGPERVGFWSGHAMQPIEVQPMSFIRRYKIILVRSVVGKAALVWIAFAIVFLTVGLNGLNEAKTLFEESFIVSQPRNAFAISLLLLTIPY